MKAIEMGVITESTMARLSELEQQKSDIKVKIAKEEIKSAVLSKEQILEPVFTSICARLFGKFCRRLR